MPGRLRVQRPSPTTVSFTVSNASPRSSSPAKILFGLQILLRALLFFSVIVALVARIRNIFLLRSINSIQWQAIWSSPFGAYVCPLVDKYNPWAIAVVTVLVVYGVFKRGYTGM